MDATVKALVKELTIASNENRISFPEVVKALMSAGVERYHADLTSGRKTYYMPDGSSETVPSWRTGHAAAAFSAEAVEQALRRIQRGEINYVQFCEGIAAAGCVTYIVSTAGKRVIYLGRSNDYFVEWFPGAKPSVLNAI